MMALKKILYVTDIVGLGGGETSLLNHLDYLDRSKFKPVFLSSKTGMLTAELEKRKIEIFTLNWGQVKRISNHVIYYPFISSLRLAKFLNKCCVDIVVANSFNSMAVIAPAAKLFNIPVVWICHGWWPTGRFTGIFINYFVSKTIAVSDFVKEKLQNQGNVHPSKIVQIPLGIDPAKYDYSRSGSSESIKDEFKLSRDFPIVGMIGRFQKIKGHHVFIKMASEISKTHPNIRYIIIGSEVFGKASETVYGSRIKELIHKLSLEKKVILTGFRDDVAQILSALDVLVVPSEVETFGMVVLEAMASGTPVISCAKGGPTEIIHDGKSGFHIDDQDPIKMAEKVRSLIDNKTVRETMRINAKKTVAQRYQIDDQVAKIEALYTGLLS